MAKDKISDYSATANSNTDIGGINIDEGCAPSGINDAIRTLMKQLKDWQSGSQDVYIHPAGSASVPSITVTGDTNTGLFFPAADTVGITTGGTERARVDSSGNLGLGVTPSAWSQGKAVELGTVGNGMWSAGSGDTRIVANAYFNSGWKYATNGTAAYTLLSGGGQTWNIAGSGTAGNAITFTQAMTLDASGNLGVGTTSPNSGARLTLSSGTTDAQSLSIDSTNTSGGRNGSVIFRGTYGAGGGGLFDAAIISRVNIDDANSSTNSQALAFYTKSGTSSPAERARIDAGGNFNLNTTGAFGKLCADIGALSFTSSNSGSSLVWGTSHTSGRPSITVASTGSGQDSALRVVVSPDNGSSWLGWTNGINIETGSNTLSWCINGNNNTSRVFSSGGVAMRLTTGGALSTVTGSLGTISDIRMKKDVVDATPKLDQLMQLRVVNYVLIDDPEERKMLGFVAQEVEQVFAGLIEEHDILDPDTKEVTMQQKTVKTTVLIPMLVKAMQEQQAIITQLQADVAALKGQA